MLTCIRRRTGICMRIRPISSTSVTALSNSTPLTTSLKSYRTAKGVVNEYRMKSKLFQPVHYAIAWERISDLPYNIRKPVDIASIHKLASKTVNNLHLFNSNSMIHTLCTMARFRIILTARDVETTFKALSDIVSSLNPQRLLTTVSLIDRFISDPSNSLHKLLEEIESQLIKPDTLKSLTPSELSTIISSYQKYGFKKQSPIFAAVEEEIICNRDVCVDFNIDVISSLCRSFASVGYHNSTLFKALEKKIYYIGDLSNANTYALVGIIWAYATALQIFSKVFPLMEKELLGRDFTSLQSRDIANIIWSYCTVGRYSKNLIEKVSSEIERRGSEYNWSPQDLSQILHGLCIGNLEYLTCFKIIENNLLKQGLQGFSADRIAYLLGGLHLNYNLRSSPLFPLIETKLMECDGQILKDMSVCDLATVLLVTSTNNLKASYINAVCTQIMNKDCDNIPTNTIILIVSSLAHIGHIDITLMKKMEGILNEADFNKVNYDRLSHCLYGFAVYDDIFQDSPLINKITASLFKRGETELSNIPIASLNQLLLSCKRLRVVLSSDYLNNVEKYILTSHTRTPIQPNILISLLNVLSDNGKGDNIKSIIRNTAMT